MAERLPLVLIMGPTAAGKTDLAVELVRRYPAEIVSVDSALVYRGMDIGTAKPSPAVIAEAPHRLVDILDPAEAYSAARFREDALNEIARIRGHGRIPVLAGGTMLYFRALTQGLARLPAADPAVRARLDAAAGEVGWEGLHARLAEVDPATAARLHPNDAQRIQRALEVWELSGRPLSALTAAPRDPAPPGPYLKFAVAPADRRVLHERIERRFRAMLDAGFIEEVRGLRARGDLDLDCPSMRAVGYRQVWEYLDGASDRETLVERGVAATRQFAKRQLTWLRREAQLTWLDPGHGGGVDRVTEAVDSVLE